MAKNKTDRTYWRLKSLIEHLELMQKRQKIFIRLHDEKSVERAISNAKENVISLILDLGNAYLAGEDWPDEMREALAIKLDSGHYFNNKKKERK